MRSLLYPQPTLVPLLESEIMQRNSGRQSGVVHVRVGLIVPPSIGRGGPSATFGIISTVRTRVHAQTTKVTLPACLRETIRPIHPTRITHTGMSRQRC